MTAISISWVRALVAVLVSVPLSAAFRISYIDAAGMRPSTSNLRRSGGGHISVLRAGGVTLPHDMIDPYAPLKSDDYIALGLACCYLLNDKNKLEEYWVIEPLTAGTLETIDRGVDTSYRRVMALTLGDLFEGDDVNSPTGARLSAVEPMISGEEARFSEALTERVLAAARTFRRRPEAQLLDLGEVADDFNFSTERKRILNQKFEPSFDDNVKQHSSIDVYGRTESESSDEQAELDKQIEELANA
ncbi:unnamed protein product [Vitrella brassicaformis CCMP3155]|uniref:Protein kinase domain-containing protein n=1 Tax=Vitrella brassicaformis (strain CCMP3155) TaxID=1169540 RepID=A0A0G4F5N3_VITBC|nr:unnamed protein product [Vitrella brassicaformis CCMP3155]|eukprot:CEM07801.1 unnamed protein product [Vitrella brassicaformis CCMP3155]